MVIKETEPRKAEKKKNEMVAWTLKVRGKLRGEENNGENQRCRKTFATIFADPEAAVMRLLPPRQCHSGALNAIMSFRNPQRSQSAVFKNFTFT